MSDLQVTPSSLRVNEGDSLTTSLSGFTPGTTLYFKVSGRGISKKDFAAGGVKGSIKVDANGVASISHTLRADKKTEGEESFSIQVFSDKKMRNPLGQSDAVTVFDTSVKAAKAPKGGGTNGGGKEQNTTLSFNDPLTGQAIISDAVNTGFFNATRHYNNAYASGQYEIEANQSTVILTSKYYDWIGPNGPKPERFAVQRSILTGKFTTDKSGNLMGTLDRTTSFGLQSDSSKGFFMETAQSYSVAKGTNIPSGLAFSPETIESASYFYSNYTDVQFDSDGRFPSTPRYNNRNDITGFADTSFFQEDWWQDPFTPNLI